MDILQMSLHGSLLILLIIPMRLVFRSKLPGHVLSLLWGIAGCRLLIPEDMILSAREGIHRLLELLQPFRFSDVINAGSISGHETDGIFFPNIPVGLYISGGGEIKDGSILPFVWLAGVLCFALYFTAAYIHCLHICRVSLPWEGIPEKWQGRKQFLCPRVPVRISDRIHSPMTFGVLRPVILLPVETDRMAGEGLDYILEHEMAHVRRWDSVRKIFLAVVLSVHWFNPSVWGMYLLANRDIELACDDQVLRRADTKRRAAYARVLVDWACAGAEGSLLASHFVRNFMEERIVNIMKYKKLTITGIALSAVMLSGAMTVFAMTPVQEPSVPEQAVSTMITGHEETGTASVYGGEMTDTQQPDTEENRMTFPSYVEDPTLGGIFETYTVEEFEAELELVKKYADGDDGTGSGHRAMEEALEKLRADDGKGEYVIYKCAFEKSWEENGYFVQSAFNPLIVMAPELEYQNGRVPLTAERYEKDIENTVKVLDEAVADGQLTPENRDIILAKMQDNLGKLKGQS